MFVDPDYGPVLANYGIDSLRFIKPVVIGDTIHVRVTITEKRESKSPKHGIVVEKCEVLNQSGETVLACEHLLMVEFREAVG